MANWTTRHRFNTFKMRRVGKGSKLILLAALCLFTSGQRLAYAPTVYLPPIEEATLEIKVERVPLQVAAAVVAAELEVVEMRVTAYCSCELCCGEWSLNRPKDKHGEDIVLGAGGVRLISGYSVAAPKSIPLGTIIKLDGVEYRVDDYYADWVQRKYGDTVDVYFSNHAEAVEFGTQIMEVTK